MVKPFGLCNAPPTFNRTMDSIFKNMKHLAGGYFDVIRVYAKKVAENVLSLRPVSEKLPVERVFVDQTNVPGHSQN